MTTANTLPRLELWSALVCNGGTRLAFSDAPSAWSVTHSLQGQETMTFSLASDDSAAAIVAEKQIARLWRSDTDFEEWIVGSVVSKRDKGGRVDVSCEPLLFALTDAGLVPEWQTTPDDGQPQLDVGVIGLTPTEIIDTYLLDARSPVHAILPWLTLGTIDPTGTIDLEWSSASPLAVLRGIIDALAAQGELCELQLRRVGTTSYAIDLLHEVGSSATSVSVRIGRNLQTLTRTTDPTQRATRIAPIGQTVAGQPTYLGLGRWLLTAAATATLALADPAGGAGPIGFDHQTEGWYLWSEHAGVSSLITNTLATNVVCVATGTIFAVDQYVEFRASATNTIPYYLDHPVYVSNMAPGIGVKFGSIDRSTTPGLSNLVPNAAMRTWTTPTSMPDGWQYLALIGGGTVPTTTPNASGLTIVAQNTDPLFTQFGGHSLQFIAPPGTIITPPIAWAPRFTGETFSCRMRVLMTGWETPALMILSFGIQRGNGTVVWWSDLDKALYVQPGADTPPPFKQLAGGVWADLVINGLDITTPNSNGLGVQQSDIDTLGTTAKGIVLGLFCANHASGYLDIVTVTPTLTALDEPTEYGGANQLWQAANVALSLLAPPQVSYAVDVVDLARLDPTLTADAFTLGGTVYVNDTELGLVNTPQRAVEIQQDLLVPGSTRITLAARTKRIIDLLLRSGSVGGVTGAVNGPGTQSGAGNGGGGSTGGTGGGVGSTGGGTGGSTGVNAPAILLSLDGSNVPTAQFSVSAATTRIKYAWSLTGTPSDSDVRNGSLLSATPWTASHAAIGDLDTIYIAAFAYTASNVESPKGFAQISGPGATDGVALPSLFLRSGVGYKKTAWATADAAGLEALPDAGNGDFVSGWLDQSGHQRHWMCGVSNFSSNSYADAEAPILDSAGTELRFGDFVASNARILSTTPVATWWAAHTQVEMLCAFRAFDGAPSSNGKNALWAWPRSGGGSDGNAAYPNASGHLADTIVGSGLHDMGATPGGVDLTTLTVIDLAADAQSADPDFSAWLNNVSLYTTHDTTADFPNFTGLAQIFLGLANDETAYWHGWIKHLVVFDTILTTTQRAAWYDFLSGATNVAPSDALTPSLSYQVVGSDVVVTATAGADDSAKIDASLSATPSAATVRATTAITTRPFSTGFPAPGVGETLHVAALGYNGTTESSLATLDIAGVGDSTGATSDPVIDDSNSTVVVDDATGTVVYNG